MKVDTIFYKDMSSAERKKIETTFLRGSVVSFTKEEIVAGKKTLVSVTDTINNAFYEKQFITKSMLVSNSTIIYANVKFVENKLR